MTSSVLIFQNQPGNDRTMSYNCNGNNCKFNALRSGSSPAINTGLNQTNLVAVVASGSTIDLHVNNQKIDSYSDSTYSQGLIGVAAADVNNPTEVVFSDAKVWTS